MSAFILLWSGEGARTITGMSALSDLTFLAKASTLPEWKSIMVMTRSKDSRPMRSMASSVLEVWVILGGVDRPSSMYSLYSSSSTRPSSSSMNLS